MAKPNRIRTSQKRSKLAFALSLSNPSMAIVISNVMYLDITHFIGDNIKVQQVFTFFKKIAHFVSIILKTLENSKCHLRYLKK